MDRANIIAGSAFRTAVYATFAVAVTLAVTAIASFFFVQKTLEKEVQRQILTEQVMLREIYERGGEAALIRTISEINNPVALSQRAIGVFGTDGLKLAGNIENIPDFRTFERTELTVNGKGNPPLPYYVHTVLFDHIVVVIGHDLALITIAERHLMLALFASGLFAGSVILLIGYTASHKSLRKLNDLESTLDHVSQGDTDIRVPMSGESDQIDRISKRVNSHLDRLSGLIVTTKATATAIAHDLKTPLSRAQLSLQSAMALLEKGQDPQNAVENVEAELDRLNGIFDTILRISRIETAAKDAEFVEFPLLPILVDLAESFGPIAEARGQSVIFSPPAGSIPPVFGDARMIKQMIVNLIQNAINHGPAGNEICIALQQDGPNPIVVIADHGPGVPAEERRKVFEPFYRLDGSRSGAGSGLGLALVKVIAERHDIEITLTDNAPGLKVTLTFPAVA
ncbi:HAMP domain-containing sensor histidine kinase [Pseudorhodobacter sp.]|uniref:HAMP domain-containing sensor histidine kinase n=1 Tax=Pseudorhodobacter sp. TaxID=1934400 RepID=UPI0026489096|nr:HAMP domain-containing sensor histidine kinase [Pseudorhodobacter sp.]MDN5787959.1 HAMP domain-containing histidine kinase [Pseudorhodobacter sp.]